MSTLRTWKPTDEQRRINARSYQVLVECSEALYQDDSRTPQNRFEIAGLLFEHEMNRLGYIHGTIRIERIGWGAKI